MFIEIITQLIIVFSVILLGYFATCKGLWPYSINRMISRFVFNVSCPLIILASVMGEGTSFEREELIQLVFISVVVYAVLVACAYLITFVWKLPPDNKGLVRFVTSFGNVTFMGFPVLLAMFGEKGVFYGSIITLPFNILIFSLGVVFVKGEGRMYGLLRKEMLFSPCIVASAIAFLMAFMGIHVPAPIGKFCHLVGDMTIPCALILVGSTLTSVSAREMMGNFFIYKTILIRLLIAPLAVMCVLLLIPCDPMVRNVAIVLSGMPSAANGMVFCLKYNRSEHNMAQCIFLSSLWCIVTIPLLIYLTNTFYANC